jgi:enoyl-CoA hydratase
VGSYANITIEKDGLLAILTVNRPDALNALDTATMGEVNDAMRELDDDESVAAVIVTGAGKAFVAGADIGELSDASGMTARAVSRLGQETFSRIENLTKPVIAAVNGFALGGGLELAMACDIRIASTKAKLGQPEVKLGLTPGFAGTQRLPRLVGFGRAKEMLMVGDPIDAATALQYGLVTQVVEPDELLDTAKTLAHTILARGPAAISLVKACVNRGANTDVETGGFYESEAFGLCFGIGEAGEGIKAFLGKRKPGWSRESD